jgi:hypothetical protein
VSYTVFFFSFHGFEYPNTVTSYLYRGPTVKCNFYDSKHLLFAAANRFILHEFIDFDVHGTEQALSYRYIHTLLFYNLLYLSLNG